MKKLIIAALTVGGLALAALSPAQAEGGCGPYGHRGFDGACHGNGFGPGRPFGHGWHRPGGFGWHHPGWDHHHHW